MDDMKDLVAVRASGSVGTMEEYLQNRTGGRGDVKGGMLATSILCSLWVLSQPFS